MGPIVGGIKLDAKVYGTSLKDFPEKKSVHCFGWCHFMTPFLYPLQACKPLNLSIIQSQTSTVQERKILSSKLPSSKLPSRSLTACP